MRIFFVNTSGIGYVRGHMVKAKSAESALAILEGVTGRVFPACTVCELLPVDQWVEVINFDDPNYEG